MNNRPRSTAIRCGCTMPIDSPARAARSCAASRSPHIAGKRPIRAHAGNAQQLHQISLELLAMGVDIGENLFHRALGRQVLRAGKATNIMRACGIHHRARARFTKAEAV